MNARILVFSSGDCPSPQIWVPPFYSTFWISEGSGNGVRILVVGAFEIMTCSSALVLIFCFVWFGFALGIGVQLAEGHIRGFWDFRAFQFAALISNRLGMFKNGATRCLRRCILRYIIR